MPTPRWRRWSRVDVDLRQNELFDAVSHGVSFQLLLQVGLCALACAAKQLDKRMLCRVSDVLVRVFQTGHDRSDVAFESHALFVVHADDPSNGRLLLSRMVASKRLFSDDALDI